jgi:hypothetical protein
LVDIFQEVEADLRAERMRALALRYGKFAAAAAVVLVLGVAAWQGMAWLHARRQRTVAMAYFAAAQEAVASTPAGSGNAKAEADFARLAGNNTPAGYRTLARLRAAALAADAGQAKLAVTLWQEVVNDPAADPLLAGLARLLSVTHRIDGVKTEAEAKPLEAELQPLLAAGNPWRPMAEEAEALIEIARGDRKAAEKTLTDLSGDPTAPQGVRGRASALLARLSE